MAPPLSAPRGTGGGAVRIESRVSNQFVIADGD
jgi:hypothetical protein